MFRSVQPRRQRRSPARATSLASCSTSARFTRRRGFHGGRLHRRERRRFLDHRLLDDGQPPAAKPCTRTSGECRDSALPEAEADMNAAIGTPPGSSVGGAR